MNTITIKVSQSFLAGDYAGETVPYRTVQIEGFKPVTFTALSCVREAIIHAITEGDLTLSEVISSQIIIICEDKWVQFSEHDLEDVKTMCNLTIS